MIRLILLPVRVAQRFSGERCAQVAAALSFSTLLGLVPMVALAAALITRLPFAAGLSDALEKFLLANLLPDKAGAVIAKYAGQFAHKAERVQLIGAMLLAVTALMQMLTIERTFNAIWRVKENRPAAAYWALPAKNVLRPHAMIGGLFAAAGFMAMQRLFSLYIAYFPAYTIVYGAFAAVPIFLLWLYLSWGVVLVGALIVAELPARSGRRRDASPHRGMGSRSNP